MLSRVRLVVAASTAEGQMKVDEQAYRRFLRYLKFD
jgi:hypothetical protein